ncbi:MAG TPA: menaquinone biosynthesis protein [Candidatus Angelobacter sp.]|nr:menaquinone biosynthesis protein [Candidatus Angelobacter sp.]
MGQLRISAISYLNTAPLMWNFENGESAQSLKQHFQFSYTIPSHCADALKAGTADIGIIPVAAYTTIPDLVIVPDVAIACKNQVRSILLVSKVPLEKIRSVATDSSSRTSSALVQIFLKKFVGVKAGFTSQAPDLREMLRWHDAGLLIGDVALQAQTAGRYVYDLAEEWRRWTYMPFVFAFWAVRKAALENLNAGVNLARVFQQSRDCGLQHIDEITHTWAGRLNLSTETIREYLTTNIDYLLDEENLKGLKLFYRYAEECGVLPQAPELRFVEQPRSAISNRHSLSEHSAKL